MRSTTLPTAWWVTAVSSQQPDAGSPISRLQLVATQAATQQADSEPRFGALARSRPAVWPHRGRASDLPHGIVRAQKPRGGVSFIAPQGEPTKEALLRRADIGLFMAKRAGRNQVVGIGCTTKAPRTALEVGEKQAITLASPGS